MNDATLDSVAKDVFFLRKKECFQIYLDFVDKCVEDNDVPCIEANELRLFQKTLNLR